MKKKTKRLLLALGLILLLGLLTIPKILQKQQTESIYMQGLTFISPEQAETINKDSIHQKIGTVNKRIPRYQTPKKDHESNFLVSGTEIYLYAPTKGNEQTAGFYGAAYQDKNGKYQLLSCQSTKQNTRKFYSLYQDYLTVSYQDFVTSLKKSQGIIEEQ